MLHMSNHALGTGVQVTWKDKSPLEGDDKLIWYQKEVVIRLQRVGEI